MRTQHTLLALLSTLTLLWGCHPHANSTLPAQCDVESAPDLRTLSEEFQNPSPEYKPWVYWFVMNGNLTREGITEDLEAMERVGIGGVIFLEVAWRTSRGSVDFMSDEWVSLFQHAVSECERLGIELTLISGPGWTGSGGPWVEPQDAMHFIVADTIHIEGGRPLTRALPRPEARAPFFGRGNLNDTMKIQHDSYYEDLFVLAYPCVETLASIEISNQKSLYVRAPYSSASHTNPFIPTPSTLTTTQDALQGGECIDLSSCVDEDGVLRWDAPQGKWIIYRFASTLTGANTRPAPASAIGFECSKMDTAPFNRHLDHYIGSLMKHVGHDPEAVKTTQGGWKMLHIDSWEVGPQNWSKDFYEEFSTRRGYDPKPYLAALTGAVVESIEVSERFLWDWRITVQELILENHIHHLKRYAHRNGLGLSLEPYDMSPNNDIAMGGIADVPMGESWEQDEEFNTAFSCIEAVSSAHLNGRPIVGVEIFTSMDDKFWRLHPGNMKEQADWALCAGLNRLVFHRFTHQPWRDRFPGLSMNNIGCNYERTQTWWELSQGWHTYLSRSQMMLRQGEAVADLLLLTPEGAPHVFTPPVCATTGTAQMPDKRGYNFDGCDPQSLMELAYVEQGRICFPQGSSYRMLVLPTTTQMTPGLLQRIAELIEQGATVMGYAPESSPSLSDYPTCDTTLRQLARELWAGSTPGRAKPIGKGLLFAGTPSDTLDIELSPQGYQPPYVRYEVMAEALQSLGVLPDFESSEPLRYTHRQSNGMDIYMLSNPSDQPLTTQCIFRVADTSATLWSAVSGAITPAQVEPTADDRSQMEITLEPYGSLFVLFSKERSDLITQQAEILPALTPALELDGAWQVAFQPKRGAPDSIQLDQLIDWSTHPNPGIKYFSGVATYNYEFTIEESLLRAHPRWHIDLGRVEVMASVELNGEPVAQLWHAPMRCEITPQLKAGKNIVRVEVANQWPNRLAGDQRLPESERVTWASYSNIPADFPLLSSGLMGPVRIGWSE